VSMVAIKLALVTAFLTIPSFAPAATDWYVATDGKADAKGTLMEPLDIRAVVGLRSPVRPGDTVWLAAGRYAGRVTSVLEGKQGRPITIRPLPGARAVIEVAADQQAALTILGAWTVWRDIEVTCTGTDRTTSSRGAYPSGYHRPTGIAIRGKRVTVAGCVVHDCGTGITALTEARETDILGCTIYNNGWQGPLTGHGNGIRSQNERGLKRIADNIVFNQFGYGIHVYTRISQISHFEIEGNVAFDNGSLTRHGQRAANLFVGSPSTKGRGIAVRDNHLWHGNRRATTCQLGMHQSNIDLVASGNTFVGLTRIMGWRKLEATGNTFVSAGTALEFHLPTTSQPSVNWNKNRYWAGPGDWSPFALYTKSSGGGLDWDGWRRQTPFDAGSTFAHGRPKTTRVVVRPTPYVRGRGTIVVYNWAKQPAVDVRLSRVMTQGTRYRILSPLDPFGAPVLEGTFDGRPIRLPITARRGPAVVGKSPLPPTVGPEWAVFLIRPVESGPKAEPVEVKVEPAPAAKE
jgi:parallel beta helix pectate lyase-like protein